MEQKEYKCVCGREFSNSQAFNGHKSHCEKHQIDKYGNLDNVNKTTQKRLKSRKKTDYLRKIKLEEEKKLEKQQKIEKWISEQHKCERCGKIMTEYFGSGRFCSKACANSHNYSEETRLKISISLIKDKTKEVNDINSIKDRFITKFCKICNNKISYKNKTGYCLECIRHSPELKDYRSNISKNASSFVKNHVTWLSRDKISYPERFWINVLNNNLIIYDHNYAVQVDNTHRYFLDFYIEKNNLKIDLEIDGKQHGYPDRKAHDLIRDNFLESKEFIVYRIKWNEINSNNGKLLMKDKIDRFLNFYNNL